MNFRSAKKLVDTAITETEKGDLFKIYLADRPRMKEIISFDDYLKRAGFKQHIKLNLDKRSDDEIMNEMAEIFKLDFTNDRKE